MWLKLPLGKEVKRVLCRLCVQGCRNTCPNYHTAAEIVNAQLVDQRMRKILLSALIQGLKLRDELKQIVAVTKEIIHPL